MAKNPLTGLSEVQERTSRGAGQAEGQALQNAGQSLASGIERGMARAQQSKQFDQTMKDRGAARKQQGDQFDRGLEDRGAAREQQGEQFDRGLEDQQAARKEKGEQFDRSHELRVEAQAQSKAALEAQVYFDQQQEVRQRIVAAHEIAAGQARQQQAAERFDQVTRVGQMKELEFTLSLMNEQVNSARLANESAARIEAIEAKAALDRERADHYSPGGRMAEEAKSYINRYVYEGRDENGKEYAKAFIMSPDGSGGKIHISYEQKDIDAGKETLRQGLGSHARPSGQSLSAMFGILKARKDLTEKKGGISEEQYGRQLAILQSGGQISAPGEPDGPNPARDALGIMKAGVAIGASRATPSPAAEPAGPVDAIAERNAKLDQLFEILNDLEGRK